MTAELEIIAEDDTLVGEAPLWDPSRQRLLWVDHWNKLVYQLYPATGAKAIISRDIHASGVALNYPEGMIFAGWEGIHLWHNAKTRRCIASEHEGEKLVFNDILADPHGRVYAASIHWGEKGMERTGHLYLLQTSGALRIVDEGIELSNGLGLSPDNGTLYFADTSARKIYAYDVDSRTGDLSRKRVFAAVPREEGIPDGLTVDSEGFVWCAHWYGAQVVRYDPDGKVERRIPMPVRQVSSVAFGGKDLTELYITTAARPYRDEALAPIGYDFEAAHHGGALYRLKLDVQGKKTYFAGIL